MKDGLCSALYITGIVRLRMQACAEREPEYIYIQARAMRLSLI